MADDNVNNAEELSTKLADKILNPYQTLPTLSSNNDPEENPSNVVHKAVSCSGRLCVDSETIIQGPRYKCAQCQDADLCGRCARDPENGHDLSHKLMECLQPTIFMNRSGMGDRERSALDNWMAWNKTRVIGLKFVPRAIREHPSALFQEGRQYVTYYRMDDTGGLSVAHIRLLFQDLLGEGATEEADSEHSEGCDFVRILTGELECHRYVGDDFYQSIQATNLATRVLDLLPGAFGDKLRGNIRCIQFDDQDVSDYDALSYTWKEIAFERSVYTQGDGKSDLDGHNEERHFVYIGDSKFIQVNTGLRNALRRLRSAEHTRTIWCDQICIDQSNVGEKNLHIQLMRIIYGSASRVVLWTGESDGHTEAATQLIEKLGTRFSRPEIETLDPGKLQEEDMPAVLSAPWMALLKFFMRPVFERRWVIQEVALATELVVMAGDHIIQWRHLVSTARMLGRPPWLSINRSLYKQHCRDWSPMIRGQTLEEWSGFRPLRMVDIESIRTSFNRRMPLSLLLEHASTFQASDPHDKIYAILGLGPAWVEDAVNIDYEMPLGELYRHITRAIIENEHTLSHFSQAGMRYQRPKGLPSWVADWPSIVPLHQFSSEVTNIPYQAAGNSKVNVRWPFPEDDDTLQTQTFKVATISHVAQETFTKHHFTQPAIDTSAVALDAAWVLCKRTCFYPGEVDTLIAFLRVWIGDVEDHGSTIGVPSSQRTIQALNALLINRLLSAFEDELSLQLDVEGLKAKFPSIPVLQAMCLLCQAEHIDTQSLEYAKAWAHAGYVINRRFFVTEEGYFGLGPLDTAPGDEVHILSGGKVPYILRPWQAPDGHCLVGDAYVAGIMHGEALDRADFEWQETYIQ